MDPLTHYLSAKVVYPLLAKEDYVTKRPDFFLLSKRESDVFVISAMFPDIDFIMRYFGRSVYLEYHRGITHSFIGIFLLSALLSLIFSRADKIEFKRMFLLSFTAMLIHILFDWTNAYGTQLFLPFSDARAALDAIFIVDIYILGTFALAVVLMFFSRKRFKVSVFFTTITLLYILTRVFLAAGMEEKLRSKTINSEKTISVGAFPDRVSPFNFKCVIETDRHFYTFDYDISSNLLYGKKYALTDLTDFEKFTKKKDVYINIAKGSHFGEVYSKFARYPFYHVINEGENTKVMVTDLRFRHSKKQKGFTAKFLIDKNMKVINEGFSW